MQVLKKTIGVAIAVHKQYCNNIKIFHSATFPKRLMTAVSGNFSIINVYASTNRYPTATKVVFCNELKHWIKKCPRSKPILLMGDFNATIGKDNCDQQCQLAINMTKQY